MVPSKRSPLTVVVRFPLFGAELEPVATAVPSEEPDVATPEYSRMAKRNGPETLIETLTAFAPPLMFSA
jgi:hypothetical protein